MYDMKINLIRKFYLIYAKVQKMSKKVGKYTLFKPKTVTS